MTLLSMGFTLLLVAMTAVVMDAWVMMPAALTPRVGLTLSTQKTLVVTRTNLVPVVSELDIATASSSTSLLLSSNSWRDFVPLAVSCLVIADILLGSPALNMVLKIINKQDDEQETTTSTEDSADDTATAESPSLFENLLGAANLFQDETDASATRTKRRERIDSEQVAQQAIDKAKNTMELRDYLERNKSDAERMQEMKRQLDNQTQDLETNLETVMEQVKKEQGDNNEDK